MSPMHARPTPRALMLALLAVSAPLVAPWASAAFFTAGPDPDVIVDARVQLGGWDGFPYSPVLQAEVPAFFVGQAYDVRLIGLTREGTGYGVVGSGGTALNLISPTGSVVGTAQLIQNGTSSYYNATFVGVRPTAAGFYDLRVIDWSGNTGATVARLLVEERSLVVTLAPSHVLLGENVSAQVSVADVFGTPITNANVAWSCALYPCEIDSDLGTTGYLVGTGAPGQGADGDYAFPMRPTRVGEYHVSADGWQANHSLRVVQPAYTLGSLTGPREAVLGDEGELIATLHNGAAAQGHPQVTWIVDGVSGVQSASGIAAGASAQLRFPLAILGVGDHAVVLCVNAECTPAAPITIVPPAELNARNVTLSALLPTQLSLKLLNATGFERIVVEVRYDPDVVEVVSVRADEVPGFAVEFDNDAATGTLIMWVAAARPGASGDLVLANLELRAVQTRNAHSTMSAHAIEYERVGASFPVRPAGWNAHGNLLGETLDGVLL